MIYTDMEKRCECGQGSEDGCYDDCIAKINQNAREIRDCYNSWQCNCWRVGECTIKQGERESVDLPD